MLRKRLAHPTGQVPFRIPREPRLPQAPDRRRDGRGAQLLVLAVVFAWVCASAALLMWLLPTHPWLVLFLVLAAPVAILGFVIGHARGWWDLMIDSDPLDARDRGQTRRR